LEEIRRLGGSAKIGERFRCGRQATELLLLAIGSRHSQAARARERRAFGIQVQIAIEMDQVGKLLRPRKKSQFAMDEPSELLGASPKTVRADRDAIDRVMTSELSKRLKDKWIVVEFDATTMKNAYSDRHVLAVIAHFVEDGQK
jgi:hypothetical protein